MDDSYFDIATLTSKYLTGTLTDVEKKHLEEWRQVSEENEAWFLSVTSIGFVRQKRQALQSVDVLDGWNHLVRKRVLGRRRSLWISLLKYAGVFVLLALVTVYVVKNAQEQENAPIVYHEILPGARKAVLHLANGRIVELGTGLQDSLRELDGTTISLQGESIVYENPDSSDVEGLYNDIIIPRGGEYVLTLPDGTLVHLNADSKLHFPVKFSKESRVVELEGEAYFQVKRDDKAPFIVKMPAFDVTVLGTEFNVSNYPEYQNIQTTLVRGKVLVSSLRKNDSYELHPGEQAVFDKQNGRISVSEVDVSYAIAWKDGNLRFRDRPLKEIMDFVSRWYDVDVEYEDEEVKDYLFGCNFNRHATIFPLLELFQSTGTVHFEVDGRKIVVSK